jgi:lysozyme
MTDINNAALDTKVTPINPQGRGGWVAVTVAALVAFEGLTNVHGGMSVGTHQSFDPRGINTVCYGHIEDVQIGDKYTKIQCEEMLANDLPRYEAQLEKCIHVAMPGYRHAAILSFTYNIGGGGLCKSSVARYINAGDWEKGCDALLLYDRAAGKVLPGLVSRRKAERKMCYNTNEPPIPDSEVMKEAHINVPSGLRPAAQPVKLVEPSPNIIAPKAPEKKGGFIEWIMEK